MADTTTKKKKNPRIVSPAGLAKYPKLSVPDEKFDKLGTYGTKLLLDPEKPETKKFLKYLDEQVDAAVEAMKQEHPQHAKKIKRVAAYKMEEDKDGNETGKVEVNFTSPAKVEAKKGKNAGKIVEISRPAVFDAKGHVLNADDLKIGGGSTIKVSFEHWPYFIAKDKEVGISRRLIATQIINLVEWQSNRDASDFGFGEEEGFDTDEFSKTGTDVSGEEDEKDDDDTDAGDF